MDVKTKNGTSIRASLVHLNIIQEQSNTFPVFNAPLHKHSVESTGSKSIPSSLHAGYCNSANPIAATLTNSFLDLLSSNGTDLRKAGVGPGSRYCVEASTWKKAADKGKDVPQVKLECTHEAALKSVGLETLKKYTAGQDVSSKSAIMPKEGKEGFVRESSEIGGKEPRA